MRPGPRYGFAPLMRELGWPSLMQVARVTGCHPRQVYRWKHDGLTERHADRVACHLGLHIGLIWPEYWDDVRYSITDEGRAALHGEEVRV